MENKKSSNPSKLRQWLENFWYYYKYHTIVSIVVAFALVVSVTQCASRVDYDYQFVLATSSAEMVPTQIEGLKNELLKYVEDENGDGEININIIDCSFSEKDSARQIIEGKRQKIQSIAMKEENILIFLMDKACFDWLESVFKNGFAEDLALSNENGKYFPLSDTAFYENAKKDFDSGYKWPKELLLTRRIVKGTLIENSGNIDECVARADKIVKNIIKAYR